MSRNRERRIREIQARLPEGWELIPKYYEEGSEYAIVKIRTDDIEKIRLMKLPESVREYFREKMKEHRSKEKKRTRK